MTKQSPFEAGRFQVNTVKNVLRSKLIMFVLPCTLDKLAKSPQSNLSVKTHRYSDGNVQYAYCSHVIQYYQVCTYRYFRLHQIRLVSYTVLYNNVYTMYCFLDAVSGFRWYSSLYLLPLCFVWSRTATLIRQYQQMTVN